MLVRPNNNGLLLFNIYVSHPKGSKLIWTILNYCFVKYSGALLSKSVHVTPWHSATFNLHSSVPGVNNGLLGNFSKSLSRSFESVVRISCRPAPFLRKFSATKAASEPVIAFCKAGEAFPFERFFFLSFFSLFFFSGPVFIRLFPAFGLGLLRFLRTTLGTPPKLENDNSASASGGGNHSGMLSRQFSKASDSGVSFNLTPSWPSCVSVQSRIDTTDIGLMIVEIEVPFARNTISPSSLQGERTTTLPATICFISTLDVASFGFLAHFQIVSTSPTHAVCTLGPEDCFMLEMKINTCPRLKQIRFGLMCSKQSKNNQI